MQSFSTPPPALVGTRIQLNCLCAGKTSRMDVFPVKVGLDNSVASLKELIVRAKGSDSLQNIDSRALRLWKVSKKGRDRIFDAPSSAPSLEFLKAHGTEMTANGVLNYFCAPVQKPDALHILVAYTAPSSYSTNRPSQAQSSRIARNQQTPPQAVLNTTQAMVQQHAPNPPSSMAATAMSDSASAGISYQSSRPAPSTPSLVPPLLLGKQLSINCICLGRTSPDDIFAVRIGLNNSYADLQELIVIAEGSWLRNVDPKSLTLWSVHKRKQAELWSNKTWPSDLAFLQSLANPISPKSSLSSFKFKQPENVHVIVNWSIRRNRSIVIAQEQSSLGEPAKAAPSTFMEAESQAQTQTPADEAITISLSVDASDESDPSSPSALSSSIVLVPSDGESVAILDSSDEAATAEPSTTAGAAITSDYAPLNVSSQASHSTLSTPHPSESACASGEVTPATSSSTTAAAATVSDCASRDVSPLNSHPSASTSHTFEPARMPASSGEAASAAFSSTSRAAVTVAVTAPCFAPPVVSSQISHPSSATPNPSESERASTVTAGPLSIATADLRIAASVKQFPPIPLALLHRAFGAFIDDINDFRSSDRKSEFMSKLSDMLSSTHTAEQRLLGFTHLLREQLGINLKSGGEAGTMTASVSGHAYVMLQSLRGNAFSLDGDPFALCYKSYEAYVGRVSDDLAKLPVLPCLHIIICGPFMSFAGSAMACACNHYEDYKRI